MRTLRDLRDRLGLPRSDGSARRRQRRIEAVSPPKGEVAQMINGHASGIHIRANNCTALVTAAPGAAKKGRAMMRNLRGLVTGVVVLAIALVAGAGVTAASTSREMADVDPAASSARLEPHRRQHGPRGNAREVPDRGHALHVVRAGCRVRRRHHDRGPLCAVSRIGAEGPGASPRAAVAAAAYSTLVYFFPAQAASLTDTYTDYLNITLAALPAAAKQAGVAVGAAAAADLIATRWGDGRDAPVGTPFGVAPQPTGVWVFAPPPSAQSAQTPWVATMRPFVLESASQFRSPPPPALRAPSTQRRSTR